MRTIDPTAMSRTDRLAELGELLAAGIQRFLAENIKSVPQAENCDEHLDVVGAVEAPCRATTELPR